MHRTTVKKIATEVRKRLNGEGTGHDWWHVRRVWQMARRIGREENANMFIVELAALLHDIADWKFHEGDDRVGSKVARKILKKYLVPNDVVDHVCTIVDHISFKGAGVATRQKTIEGKVVQDADRLDAIGAIGIARAFAFGGYRDRPLHDPRIKPAQHKTKSAYFQAQYSGTTINHFYEKLLLLRDRMNTRAAKKIANKRHRFLQEYLSRFFQEWEGKI